MARTYIAALRGPARACPVALAGALLLACTRPNPEHRLRAPVFEGGVPRPEAGAADRQPPPVDAAAGADTPAPPLDAAAGADLPPPINAGLVLHWRLDEASGARATDDSGAGLHGNYVGSVPPAPADVAAPTRFPNPRSRQFTASLAHGVQLAMTPAALRPTTGITVSIWFRTRITGRADLVAQGTDYFIRYMTGEIEFVRRRPAGTSNQFVTATGSAPNANDGNWHHAAGVATPNTTAMYLDGQRVARDSNVVPFTYVSTGLDVGRSAAGNLAFEGWLDDLRIYGRALTEPEIQALAAGAP